MKSFESSNNDIIKGGAYLFGAYAGSYDVQQRLYSYVPIMIGVTMCVAIGIIAFSFGSIFVALRLAFTIAVSLSITYGLMVLVYQHGPGQRAFAKITPHILESPGVYWIIPIMSFSILVGLALDYDIFLMSRAVEFRLLGWSDRASICLAIEKTAGIITAGESVINS